MLAAHRSRARELVESGLLDRATQIAELAHSLTDSAVAAMDTELSRPDLRHLRGAAFEAITFGIIGWLDRVRRL